MRNLDPTAAIPNDPSSSREPRYFIGGIQRNISQQDLERYFGGFGNVCNVVQKRDSAGNLCGYGWVTYRGPPGGLLRPEPHILKGVVLTVEEARSRGHPSGWRSDRRLASINAGGMRRRRRSRSLSSASASSSSSFSTARRNPRRRNSPSRGERSGAVPRMPSITLSGGRLPKLATPPLQSPMSASIATLTPTATSASAPIYNSTSNGGTQDKAGAAATNESNETYLCIPLTLCPHGFLEDPRTFCARLDQSRVGGLNIVPPPFPSTSVSTPGAAPVSFASAAFLSVPPPPPPPLSSSSSSSLQQHRNLLSMTGQGSSGAATSASFVSPSACAGSHRVPKH